MLGLNVCFWAIGSCFSGGDVGQNVARGTGAVNWRVSLPSFPRNASVIGDLCSRGRRLHGQASPRGPYPFNNPGAAAAIMAWTSMPGATTA